MDPVDRVSYSAADRVGDRDHEARIHRLDKMLVVRVSVAQVVAELYSLRHAIANANESLHDVREGVCKMRRHDAFEKGELDRGVPLNRELIVRDSRADLI